MKKVTIYLVLSAIILVFVLSDILRDQWQNLNSFELVDEFKIDGVEIKVYFNDPCKELFKKYPDFDSEDDRIKHELLSNHLLNNTLYVFQTSKKSEILKSYQLKGSPRKARSHYCYNLDIVRPDSSIEKTIDKIEIGGSFFEHMSMFQASQWKERVGKGGQIWGYFTKIEPYRSIKNSISELIRKDMEHAIPDDILLKEVPKIEPLFDYQSCGLNTVKKRLVRVTVLEYDPSGKIISKYPRTETDTELYFSSVGDDLTGVTTFPFFSSTDKMEVNDSIIKITSSLDYLNYYLKDIVVTQQANSQQVTRIEGILIIHGRTIRGNTTHYELYVAEFAKVGGCHLPKTVKFCPLNDINYTQPRIIIEIEYELK